MEFLQIYDVTEEFKETDEGKYYEKYFIQEDVHDYHVFRIFKGNYDDENEFGYGDDPSGGYTIERENIPKYEVLEILGYTANDREITKVILDKLADAEIVKGVIDADTSRGLANWDFHVYDDIEECIRHRVTEDSWDIYRI